MKITDAVKWRSGDQRIRRAGGRALRWVRARRCYVDECGKVFVWTRKALLAEDWEVVYSESAR